MIKGTEMENDDLETIVKKAAASNAGLFNNAGQELVTSKPPVPSRLVLSYPVPSHSIPPRPEPSCPGLSGPVSWLILGHSLHVPLGSLLSPVLPAQSFPCPSPLSPFPSRPVPFLSVGPSSLPSLHVLPHSVGRFPYNPFLSLSIPLRPALPRPASLYRALLLVLTIDY